jgi:hypothetical protein
MARSRLADEVYTRAMNGVVERIYRDGMVVAERHRYDNRLTMAVLARLDARADRAEEKGAPVLGVVARWDDFLDALGDDRRDDGLALLTPAAEPLDDAGDRELHPDEEPQMDGDLVDDPHSVWEEDGRWRTDYPPPADFDGEKRGAYGSDHYSRTLAPGELAAVEADLTAHLAEAELQRDRHFAALVESADHIAATLEADRRTRTKIRKMRKMRTTARSPKSPPSHQSLQQALTLSLSKGRCRT